MSDQVEASLLPQLVGKVFKRLEEKNLNLPVEQRKLSQEDLLELHGLFGDILEQALDLIDRDQIKLYSPVSKTRELFEICGRNGTAYKLFPNINYCSCKAFKIEVLANRHQYTCKHVLSVKLAQLLGHKKEETIPDDTFNFLILEIVKQISAVTNPVAEP